jgi:hypothetical protein
MPLKVLVDYAIFIYFDFILKLKLSLIKDNYYEILNFNHLLFFVMFLHSSSQYGINFMSYPYLNKI